LSQHGRRSRRTKAERQCQGQHSSKHVDYSPFYDLRESARVSATIKRLRGIGYAKSSRRWNLKTAAQGSRHPPRRFRIARADDRPATSGVTAATGLRRFVIMVPYRASRVDDWRACELF